MDVLAIPGYAEAVLKERVVRDAAFLGITESIGAFEVVPMTLRHWLVLRMSGNALIKPQITPTPDELATFLWFLSPSFKHNRKARAKFMRRCHRIFYPVAYGLKWAKKWSLRRRERKLIEAAKLIDGARAYVQEAFQDKPPVQSTLGYEMDFYSDGAFFCCLFGREFGWSQEDVLNTPLKRIFQYLNALKQSNGSKVPLFNPSDKIKADWAASQSPRSVKPANGHDR